MNAPGYEQLSEVLRAAFDQAAYGKGAERHARGNDFDKQHMQTISSLLGTERGMAFQVCKKLTEGLDMEAYDRFERELLGVIIYTAGIIIWRKKNNPPTAEVVKPDVAHCPHCGVGEGELHRVGCVVNHAADTQPVITVNPGTALSPPIDPAGVDISDEEYPSDLPPDQWQKGDVVVALHKCAGQFSRLKRYTLRSANELQTVKVVADDSGNENGWGEHNFRFHSRPTK